MEELFEEEAALADELRSYCSHYGAEKPESLDTTGTLLWKMGKIYLKMTKVTTGMRQKLTFIRCAVLLYAAQARFCITKNNAMKIVVTRTISDFETKLVRCCGCKLKAPLNDISGRMLEKVIQIRRLARIDLDRKVARTIALQDKDTFMVKTQSLLSEERAIDENSSRDLSRSAMKDEQIIISQMRKFMENITNQYRSMMCEIAEECRGVLPQSPCNFCIVGLGSLARGEVTMYSDFEHVILLEANSGEAVANCDEIAEYFRWYSVLFQVIIVGMGETIIPSVTVKSLNDAYSGDPFKNWFYDKYTPRGISFDGMLPHSCNIPIGRQQTTSKRRHTVELIQTPKMMASFLSYGECEKNGYYLGEVLRQTCFVYGDMNTYNEFVHERQTVIDLEGAFSKEKYEKFVVNNSNVNVREIGDLTDFTSFDTKNVFYRPVVTLLTLFGQVHAIKSDSSFNLLDQLLDGGMIDKTLHHDLSYALAVACEMRWKLYLLADEQRHSVGLEDITSTVGENAVHACKNVLPQLRTLISGENIPNSVMDKPEDILISISGRGNFEQAIQFGEKVIKELTFTGKDTTFFKIRVLCDCYKAGCIYPEKRTEYWTKAEILYLNDVSGTSLSYADAIEIFLRMSVMYYTQGRFNESLEESRKYFEANRMMLEVEGKIHLEFAQNFQQYHELIFQRMNATDALKHFEDVLWKDPSIAFSLDCQFTKRYYEALLLALKEPADGGCLKMAKEEFYKLATDVKSNVSKLQQPRRFLITVIFRQISYFWFEDAVRSIEYIEQNPAPAYSQYELALVEESCIDIMKFFCFCRMGMYKEAVAWAESDIKITASDLDKCVLHRLTRGLVSKLWRHLQSKVVNYGKKERSLILIFIAQFAVLEKVSDLFSCPRPMVYSNSLFLDISSLKNFYGYHFGTTALQALQNIRCVVILMLLGLSSHAPPRH